jgi:AcrR family transcriptional regulator
MPNPDSVPADSPGRRGTRRAAAGGIERLLDGAQRVFAERGYRAASVSEICARSAVGIGTFYAHFGHKRELLKRICVERSVLLTLTLTADDLLDHDHLVARLGTVIDDPAAAGLLRAWYEAVLEEPEIARFHATWRESTLKHFAATVAQAQGRSASPGPWLDPAIVSWSVATLAREMAIHDRGGAPDTDGLARLIGELVFGPILVTAKP